MGLSRKSIFLNLFWSTTSFITGVARMIFLVPVFTSNWDNKSYGFWILIFNFYAISVYVIEGYSRFTINEYSKVFFKDKEAAYKYFGNGLRFLVFLCGAALVSLSVILQFSEPAEKLFHVNEAVIDFYRLKWCLILVFGLACIHSISKYLGYAISPHGKIYIPERFIAVYVFAEALIWVVAALGILSLFPLFVLYSVSLSLLSVIFVIIIYRRHSYYKKIFWSGDFTKGCKASARSLSLVVNNFCEKSTVEGLAFIVSAMYSAFMVPVYTNVRAMANFMVTGANMVVATFTIEYQRHSVNRDGKSLFNLFNATWLLVGIIVNYGVVVFYPFLPGIFRVWTNNNFELDIAFFNCILATSIFIVYGSNIITYLKSINRIREVFAVAVSRAAILFSLIIFFPKQLVFIGLSLLITEFIINVVLLNIILYVELGRMQCVAVAGKMFWNALPFVITACYLLTNQFLALEPYLKMIITIIVLTAVYILQIMKVDNEVLLVRLQIIKYKLLGKAGK